MRIVFYSTNSNRFDGENIEMRTFPPRAAVWDALAARYPEHEFCVVTMLPGMFLLDVERNTVRAYPACVRYEIVEEQDIHAFAARISALRPDVAVAATFWVTPYDWLPLSDAMVARELCAQGIRTVCQQTDVSLDCLDKFRTHNMLTQLGLAVPPAVYVHHALFWCERGRQEIASNVYKEYVLSQIKELHLPLVIKDTVGLSSYGMEVVSTYNEARAFLCSKKNSSDRIVEEYISGLQFGTEIYGIGGAYVVLPPFLFSVNKYGITSPKQSVKLGPVTNPAYHIPELISMLRSLASALHFGAVTQVDLVFSNGTWYIIEINPRLSGMSETYAAAQGKPLLEILTGHVLDTLSGREPQMPSMKYVCNFKLPILPEERLSQLADCPGVRYVQQIHNKAARQEREKGYGEIIFGGTDTPQELITMLESLTTRFPEIAEPVFLENARQLAAYASF